MPLPYKSKSSRLHVAFHQWQKFHTLQRPERKTLHPVFLSQDFSVGCTNEACSFRDTFEVFHELNIKIIGVSRDSMESHQKFKKTLNLPFDLLGRRRRESLCPL
jgi:peroxiredoxin Q/BCP